MSKIIIWSLFDSETAITQQLNSEKYHVFSIGLPSDSAITDFFIKMDLGRKNCLKKLERLPKPDIIFASPPCETWVTVSIGNVRFFDEKRNFNEHNLYWQKNFKPNNYKAKHRDLRLLGQRTAYFTAKIIQKFKPRLWVIENGATSLIFKYLFKFHGLSGIKNLTYYNNYDESFSQKPTVFFSNKKLFLKTKKIESTCFIGFNKNNRDAERKTGIWKQLGFASPTAYLRSKFQVKETYCDRSAVPIGVYQHILRHFENKEQLTLF